MSGSDMKSPVIIAGGGIGGLATAIGMRAAAQEVVVLEKAHQFAEIGAGIQLAPNAFAALTVLGAKQGALKRAVYIDRLVMMDGVDGREIASISLGPEYHAWFKNPYAVIHRADLHETLLTRCRELGVELRANSEVTSFEQDSKGVAVRTSSGEAFRGAALIGADGIRSRVRQSVVGDGEPKVAGHVCYRAVLPAEKMPEELRWHAMTVWVAPKIHFVHYPVSGSNLFNLVATFHSSSATSEQYDAKGTHEEVWEHFKGLPPAPRSIFETVTTWRRWVLGDREPVANWTQGRVTLMGDAAHPTYQYFAQGACMALEDAVCLQDEVKRSPEDLGAAFIAYQDRRITRTARIVLSARAIGQYFFHAGGVERLVRNELFRSKNQEDFHRGLDWVWGYGRDR